MEKQSFSEAEVKELLIEAVKKAKIEAYNIAIKIASDSYSRGSLRVALFNKVAELEGRERA